MAGPVRKTGAREPERASGALRDENAGKTGMVFAAVLSFVLFLSPLLLDIKLSRPKLFFLEIGLCALFFGWLLVQFMNGTFRLRRSLLNLPVLLYGVMVAAFFVLSPDRPVAESEFKRSVLSCITFLVAANVVGSYRHRLLMLCAWLAGSLLAVLYGLLQHAGGIGILLVPKMDRIMSTFGNPIFFAAHLVVTIPVAMGLLPSTKSRALKVFLSGYIVLGLAALYYTKTRAAFIAFGVSFLVLHLMNVRSWRTRIRIAAATVAVAAVFVVATKGIWLRQQAHPLIWRDTLVMWTQHPVLGAGLGAFHIHFPAYASDELKKIWPPGQFIVNDAHNEYVQNLAETGIVGFGVFAWLIASFFVLARRVQRREEGPRRFLATGIVAGGVGILVQNFFSVDMRFVISSLYLFFLMGLLTTFDDRFHEKPLTPALRSLGIVAAMAAAVLTFPKVLEPYLAQRNVAAAPDFFDERVLEPARTIAELEALAAAYPTRAPVFEKLGWVHAKEKNWQKAISNYQRAAELDPSLPGPLNNLGNISFLTGDRERAIEYWNRSLAVKGDQVDSRLNLATAYYYQGQLKEAAAALQRVLAVDPKNEKAKVMLRQMTE